MYFGLLLGAGFLHLDSMRLDFFNDIYSLMYFGLLGAGFLRLDCMCPGREVQPGAGYSSGMPNTLSATGPGQEIRIQQTL